jgi:hypothetical protein
MMVFWFLLTSLGLSTGRELRDSIGPTGTFSAGPTPLATQSGNAVEKNLVTIILICCLIFIVSAVLVYVCCFRRVRIDKDPTGSATLKGTTDDSLFQNEGTGGLF